MYDEEQRPVTRHLGRPAKVAVTSRFAIDKRAKKRKMCFKKVLFAEPCRDYEERGSSARENRGRLSALRGARRVTNICTRGRCDAQQPPHREPNDVLVFTRLGFSPDSSACRFVSYEKKRQKRQRRRGHHRYLRRDCRRHYPDDAISAPRFVSRERKNAALETVSLFCRRERETARWNPKFLCSPYT